ERDVDDRALVGHQCRERHDLVLIHQLAESSPALDGFAMLTVFRAPTFKDFVMVIGKANRKLEVIDVIAGLNLTEERGSDLQVLSRAIELVGDDIVEVEIFLNHRGHEFSLITDSETVASADVNRLSSNRVRL